MVESLDSKRLRVINTQIFDIQRDVADLSDSIVDREREEAVKYIESIRNRLNMLREQITDGDII